MMITYKGVFSPPSKMIVYVFIGVALDVNKFSVNSPKHKRYGKH